MSEVTGLFPCHMLCKKVIMTAFDKVKDLKWGELNALANRLLPCIATDMDNGMILKLVQLVYFGKMHIADTARVPFGDDSWEYATIDGMGVILPKVKLNAKRLQEYIYSVPETAETNK